MQLTFLTVMKQACHSIQNPLDLVGSNNSHHLTGSTKTQITVLACTSAAGYALPPLWMDSELFTEWFTRHFLNYAPSTRPLYFYWMGTCPITVQTLSELQLLRAWLFSLSLPTPLTSANHLIKDHFLLSSLIGRQWFRTLFLNVRGNSIWLFQIVCWGVGEGNDHTEYPCGIQDYRYMPF